ncbi:MAG: hypothetical protein GXO83_03235 [Chlorobi bacterium]|nr:hypothetical protein [Chlorobiota bacterium]
MERGCSKIFLSNFFLAAVISLAGGCKDPPSEQKIINIPMPVLTKNVNGNIVKDAGGHDFRQIFVMPLDWTLINNQLKNSFSP